MARAVVASAYGGPEVLSVVEHDPGPPGPGQVVIEMRAAGVNPADWKSYSGAGGDDPARLPLRVGYELAGVVDDVGAGVDLRPGDEVMAYPAPGAYADKVLVASSAVARKPASLDWAEAGSLLLAGTTAVHAVRRVAVGAGDTVLVHGASGGVGSIVVQLAHHAGARVIGTAHPSKHDHLVELGAVPVAYGPGLRERVERVATGGVHAAVDTAGTDEALDVSVELVRDRRRILTIAGFARAARLGLPMLGGPGGDPTAEEQAVARRRVAELAGVGVITVSVGGTYHLADVTRAHRTAMAGTRGRVVLVP